MKFNLLRALSKMRLNIIYLVFFKHTICLCPSQISFQGLEVYRIFILTVKSSHVKSKSAFNVKLNQMWLVKLSRLSGPDCGGLGSYQPPACRLPRQLGLVPRRNSFCVFWSAATPGHLGHLSPMKEVFVLMLNKKGCTPFKGFIGSPNGAYHISH